MKKLALLAASGLVACNENPVDPTNSQLSYDRIVSQQSVTGHVERDLIFAGTPPETYSFSAVLLQRS